jgi:hypothetical protein
MLYKSAARILLIGLEAFLGVTAAAGGLALLTGAIAPPPQLLAGSPFTSYTLPGLALLVLVGGSALAAMILLLRRHPWGAAASALAGVMIMGFEIVEVWAIGSEPGLARNLQLFYFTLGLLSAALALVLWPRSRTASLAQ